MNCEESRLRTFRNWPINAPVDPRRVAKAGFYYMGQGLEVQCFSCGGRISEWNYGDKVMTRHRSLDPRCPFVISPALSGNIPITNLESSSPVTSNQPEIHTGEETGQVRTRSTRARTREQSVLQYENESARLESFANWPIPFIVSPERLAKAGFYYAQQGDKVRCAFCSGLIGQWEQGDDPETEHRRHFPTCSFILARCAAAEQNPVTPGGITMRESVSDEADSTLKSLGVQNHRIARHPKYTSTDARIATYTTWPGDVAQTAEQLAEAGFYYAGSGDQVRCFHCDGGLSKWDPSDDPWIEHARWFPECGFVVLVKGQKFIDEAMELKPPITQETSSASGMERVSAPKHTSNNSITNGATPRVRQVTEQELEGLMTTEFATAALQLGLDQSRVKMALRQKVEQTGQAFSSADDLIVATLDIQFEEAPSHESEDTWSTPLNSPLLRRAVRNVRRNSSTEEMRTDNSSDSSDSDSRDIMVKSLPTLQTPYKSPTTVSSLPDITSLNKERSVSLEEENRKLKEARLCKICMDNEVCIVFLPCGHLVTCVNCAHSLADCPVCRQTIKATVRTFLS